MTGDMLRARYRRILNFFAGELLLIIWWDLILPRIGFRALSHRTRPERLRRLAARFRKLAVTMGGVMIKVGQWLSARLDVLPPEITDELTGLQDEVAAEEFSAIRAMIEAEFGQPLEVVFSYVSPEPVAAASIGQVHSARLRPEYEADLEEKYHKPVVIKVQRPNIEQIIATDLHALDVVGGWLQIYRPIRRHADVPALLREFSQSLFEECDYLHEGKNAETFAENFKDVPDVVVPAVYWAYTTRRVLTLEDVAAIKITDYEAIKLAGVDRPQIAARLFDIYLKQVLEDHFFHADPHPGNLFILPLPPQEEGVPNGFKIVFVDFGMAGKITDNVVNGLRELIIAVAQKDPVRVIKAYQVMGVLLPGADIELLTKANQKAFEAFWGKTTPELMEMRQTEAVQFIIEFRGLLFNNPFQLPENMILLGRCLSILNGLCTGIDPDFNVWRSAIPWAEKLIAAELRGQWRVWLGEAVDTLRSVSSLPRRAETLINRMEQGQLEMRSPELNRQFQRVEHAVGQLAAGVFFAAFLLAGVQVYLAGEVLPAAGLGAAALIALAVAVLRK